MELKISLAPSRIRAGLNALIFIAALVAIAISALFFWWKILFVAILCALSLVSHYSDAQAQSLTLKAYSRSQPDLDDVDNTEQSGLSGTISLLNGRYLEVRLQSAWCLSWIQILSLKSHDCTRALVILPDSCDSISRRRLRKLLITRTC